MWRVSWSNQNRMKSGGRCFRERSVAEVCRKRKIDDGWEYVNLEKVEK